MLKEGTTSIHLPRGLPRKIEETGEPVVRLIERGIEAFWKESGVRSTEVERLTRKFLRDIEAAAERDAQVPEDERRAAPRRPGRKPGSHLPFADTPTGKRLAAEQGPEAGGDAAHAAS